MTAAQITNPIRRNVLERLSTEWRHLAGRAADLEAVRRWGLPGGEILTLDDVLVRCGYRPRPRPGGQYRVDEPEVHDAYLLRLLTVARDEPLAARIVLQRILPALCALARRHAAGYLDQLDLLDELVGNAWAAIRNYPVERRRRSVVPNLVRDIGFQTIVRPIRKRHATELPTRNVELRETEHSVDVEPLDELVDLLHEARRCGLAQGDIDLICELVTLGRPEEVAAVRRVTPRTIRNRRDVIVRRLRDLAPAAA